MEIRKLPPASFHGPSAKPPKTTGRFSDAVLPRALPRTFLSKVLPRLFREKEFLVFGVIQSPSVHRVQIYFKKGGVGPGLIEG